MLAVRLFPCELSCFERSHRGLTSLRVWRAAFPVYTLFPRSWLSLKVKSVGREYRSILEAANKFANRFNINPVLFF